MVVVNPAPGDEPQTIVVPEQAETVYVIGDSLTAGMVELVSNSPVAASRNESETIVDSSQNSALESMLKVRYFQ